MIIAVDYDDTILQNKSINLDMINYLLERKKKWAKVILWTVREGKSRSEAIEVCRNYGLEFDGIAEGKILADLYIDDKAKRPEEVIAGKRPGMMGRQQMTRLSEQRSR